MPSDVRIPPPRRFSALRIQTATITVNYISSGSQDGYACYPWPEDARVAFNYAVGIWESLITSPVPIVINACWADLGAGILGSSRATSMHKNFSSAPVSDTWYAAALANALSGNDLNETDWYDSDGDSYDADAEMNIAYNRGFDWYFGTDGSPAEYETDFASVVLHEICHGLGFAGSMTKSASLGYWGWGEYSEPAAYDQFAEEGGGGSGVPLLSYAYGSETLGSALTSDDVYFDSPNANAANGGVPPKLYTPATWAPGSSYSHLDYATFNDTSDQLMVWQFSFGESTHHPGDIALGMLQDLGWSLDASPTGPKVTSITPNSGSYTETVHISDLSGSNFQSGASVKLTKSDEPPINATSETVVSSSTITCDFDLTGAATGWWDVVVTNPDSLSGTLPEGFEIRRGDVHSVHLPLLLRRYPPSGPEPGLWEGLHVEFYVSPDRSYVDDFGIHVSVTGCGDYTITHTPQEPVRNDEFSFGGGLYASGTFSSGTAASGTTGLDSLFIPDCGHVSGGPWPWSASWQSGAQPSASSAEIETLAGGVRRTPSREAYRARLTEPAP